MIFTATELAGAFVVELQKLADERGFFARAWCRREFEAHGLETNLVQCNISHNTRRGTLRGMHFQAPPFEEAKLVRCMRGALFDVILDLRPKFDHIFEVDIGRALGCQLQDAVRSARLCAWISNLGGRHRSILPNVRVSMPPSTRAACAGMILYSTSTGHRPSTRCPQEIKPTRITNPRQQGIWLASDPPISMRFEI